MKMSALTATAPHMHGPSSLDDLLDWGPVETMIKGQSHTYGRLISKGPNGDWECGVWVCTPGTWRIAVPRDEFCHFVSGRVIYRRDDSDEVIEATAGTCVLFPAGWTGTAEITETLRNICMLV